VSLKIGELAKRAGLTVRTLHHYDHIGLLAPSGRSESGYRLYNQADVIRLHRIQALKQFGCSLADIRVFLQDPATSPVEILTRQMRVLEDRAQRALILWERLFRLKEQLCRGEDTGVTDWLTILEMMTMYEKHLTKQELDTLLTKKAAGNLDVEWGELSGCVQNAMDRGLAPESEKARELALRWMRLLKDTTGNDALLALKLKTIHREEQKARLFKGITPEMIDYLTRSFARARAALLAKYLSPAELDAVSARQAAHASEWPPLIAEVRQKMEEQAVPEDPAVQMLAGRWENLFRASYSGSDRELEGKIRSAFQKEPDLLVSIGIDRQLIAFMERALELFRRAKESDSTSPDSIPKQTALRVATYRAAHQLLDRPLVFEDPLALKVLGASREDSLREDLSQYNTPLLKGLRISVAIRSRVAEEEWARSRQRGVKQYVILGAGLDTFAYRDHESSRIFEVDLPATQRWKRNCLRTAGIEEPDSLTFVPIDFERSTLAEALDEAGFDRNAPGFFSWLGVTMYLEEKAIRDTLRFIASLARESGVVFDYVVLPSLLTARERAAMEAVASRAAGVGEPWKTCFAPASLVEMLHSVGFGTVEDYGPEHLNARYLSGRSDGLRKSGVSRLVCARI
jgi:methyltransferase (TIGR00027 family)